MATFREETAWGRRLDSPSRLFVCPEPSNRPPIDHIPILSTHKTKVSTIRQVVAKVENMKGVMDC